MCGFVCVDCIEILLQLFSLVSRADVWVVQDCICLS
jgi:hypothetical protein